MPRLDAGRRGLSEGAARLAEISSGCAAGAGAPSGDGLEAQRKVLFGLSEAQLVRADLSGRASKLDGALANAALGLSRRRLSSEASAVHLYRGRLRAALKGASERLKAGLKSPVLSTRRLPIALASAGACPGTGTSGSQAGASPSPRGP
jgi:hypothetical protein